MNYLDAWRQFTDSPEFAKSSRPETLGKDPKTSKVFLQNRLISAFEAGWKAASVAEETGMETK